MHEFSELSAVQDIRAKTGFGDGAPLSDQREGHQNSCKESKKPVYEVFQQF